MTKTRQTITLAGALTLLIGGVVLLQGSLAQRQMAMPKLQKFTYLPQGEYLRTVVLGFQQIAADLLWIEVIQAMGERTISEEAGHWMAHAFDVITTLDPRFVRVYQIGGIALTTLVHLPLESNRLLEKGIQHNPETWELSFLLGFNYYFDLHDDRHAAEYIARASLLPGAPPYLAGLAARLYASARAPDVGIEFLEKAYSQISDPNVKKALEQRLKELAVERDLQLLEKAIQLFQVSEGRVPERLQDLVFKGYIGRLPIEPFGGSYLYDPKTQKVRSSEMKERMKVYRP
jgi:tetratricopeptide (TPR) repeat protein